ncbi:MAG: hypothetical protein JSV21_11720 [Nitrospirota bacterium]|nr:MAG: hypothetical protein JSV21_11720 [Nitrospirota bacterium]
MNDKGKLKVLIDHWKEHNTEHARTYSDWADRMKAEGIEGASSILADIVASTEQLNDKLESLKRALA